jgi:hypothetical protein
MRTPISRRRCATKTARAPYNPIAVTSRPVAPMVVIDTVIARCGSR